MFSGHSSRGGYTVNYSVLLLKHLLLVVGYYTSALKWYRLLAFPPDSPSRPEATEYPDLQNWSSEDSWLWIGKNLQRCHGFDISGEWLSQAHFYQDSCYFYCCPFVLPLGVKYITYVSTVIVRSLSFLPVGGRGVLLRILGSGVPPSRPDQVLIRLTM